MIKGNTGDRGPQGEKGEKGEKGDTGDRGPQGPQGVKGNGIKSTDITYQAWSNGTSIPSGTWVSTPPDTSAENPYLWTKTVITYTDGNTSTSYSVGSTIKGVDVGGRNLLKQYIGAGGKTSKIDDLSINIGVGPSTGDTYFFLKSWLPLTGGEIYTISCDAENVPSGAPNWTFAIREQHSLFTININKNTSSSKILCEYALQLLDRIINPHLLVRRITIYMTDLVNDLDISSQKENVQFDLFSNSSLKDAEKKKEQRDIKDEKQIQKVILDIKNKYGKNAILKGMNLEKGATARERNKEIGGHHA